LGDLTVPERLKVYVWIRSVTLHVDRVPEYFTIRAGLNGGVAAVSEVYSLHDLQKISADAGEPLLPVTIQLPFGQFGFIVYYTDEITVDSASIFVELKAWSADSPDNLVESEVGLIVPHVSEVPGGGELVWGVPDGKISQNYSIMSPDNRFSADIVLGSLEAEQKVLLPENWGPFPMQLNPLVTHAWVAGASGDNWELEARYLVGTPDWLIPEEEGWDCPPTIFFERSLGVKSMKLKKTPDNFPNGENAWYPLGETPIYTPDNFLMVGAPLTLQFMMYQLSGGKKKNIKEFNAEVPVMPVLSDYGSQFKHTVFVPNWVTIGDDKAGVMVRFENETQQGAIPPLKTGLILFDGDQTLPGTAIVDSAAGNMGSHTIQIDQTTIGQVLVLGYSIPWANLGGITLQTFPLKEFDEWAASIDWSAVAPSDQQTVPDPTESLEPLEHVELEQPQPYDDWYPAGFFGTNSSYVKPANLQDQQLRSTLYFKLEPPLQSKALWIHVAMAGVLLTSTLRIDVLP
jgi:hypothetical protein